MRHLIKENSLALCVFILVIVFSGCGLGNKDWGHISISEVDGFKQVVIENSQLRVVYGNHNRHKNKPQYPQTYITSFIIKEFGEDQGDYLDAAAGRRGLRSARIIHDGKKKKTVRLVWDEEKGDSAIQEISIFPKVPLLEIKYFRTCINIVDIGWPGGDKEKDGLRKEYVVYGANEWQRLRKSNKDSALLNHSNPHHRLTTELYPQYPSPFIDTPDWKGFAPEPLNYNGWLIMGIYNKDNLRGFGRVIHYEENSYMKFLWKKGFELFPFWRGEPEPRPFKSFLFAVRNGEKEILELGKKIANERGREPL